MHFIKNIFKKISLEDCNEYYVEYSVDDMSIDKILIRDFRGTKSIFPQIVFNGHVIKYTIKSNNLNNSNKRIVRIVYKYANVYSFNSNGCDRLYKRLNDNIEGIILTCIEGGIDIDDSLIMKFIEEYPNL